MNPYRAQSDDFQAQRKLRRRTPVSAWACAGLVIGFVAPTFWIRIHNAFATNTPQLVFDCGTSAMIFYVFLTPMAGFSCMVIGLLGSLTYNYFADY